MVYSGMLHYQVIMTGSEMIEGIIGVLLGLYICSHPAANLVDILFFGHGVRRQFSSKGAAVLWVGFNVMVLLTGWLSIFVGTTRIVSRAE